MVALKLIFFNLFLEQARQINYYVSVLITK